MTKMKELIFFFGQIKELIKNLTMYNKKKVLVEMAKSKHPFLFSHNMHEDMEDQIRQLYRFVS